MIKRIGRFELDPTSNHSAVWPRPETNTACCRLSHCVSAICLAGLLAVTLHSSRAAEPPRNDKPSTERREVGKFTSKGEILIRRSKDGEWERIPVNGLVHTGEPLVSLPGCKSEVDLTSGVRLLLWGSVPELRLPLPLLESAVTL